LATSSTIPTALSQLHHHAPCQLFVGAARRRARCQRETSRLLQ
jgi:hypothetical protein